MKFCLRQALCVCLCLAVLLMPMTVSAAAPTFAVGKVPAKPGETVEVTVSTQNNPGIISFRLFVEYNTTALELISAKESAFSGVVLACSFRFSFAIPFTASLETLI